MIPCDTYVKWLAFHYEALLDMYGFIGLLTKSRPSFAGGSAQCMYKRGDQRQKANQGKTTKS